MMVVLVQLCEALIDNDVYAAISNVKRQRLEDGINHFPPISKRKTANRSFKFHFFSQPRSNRKTVYHTDFLGQSA